MYGSNSDVWDITNRWKEGYLWCSIVARVCLLSMGRVRVALGQSGCCQHRHE